jgi:AcrR family transcriptional regulator
MAAKLATDRSDVNSERSIAMCDILHNEMAGRRSAAEARDTRESILSHAASVASVDGLDGLTIGRLASELDMSKAGVIGHFGTKEELQLATLEVGAEIFRNRVWEPAAHHDPGLPRLLAICESWVSYVAEPSLPGGCLIAAVSFEFDGREGRVHDAIAKWTGRWRKTLIAEIETAKENGDLPAHLDAEQAAWSLEALTSGMNPASQLHGDHTADWSLRAMRAVLGLPPQ